MNNLKRTVAAFATVGLTVTGGTAVANASTIDADRLISGSFFSDLIEQFFPETPETQNPIAPLDETDEQLESDRAEFETSIDEYLAQNYAQSPELAEAAESVVAENEEAGWPETSEDVVGLEESENEGVRCAASLIANEDLETVTDSIDDATRDPDENVEGATDPQAEALDGEYGIAVSGDEERTYLIVCMEGEVLDQAELDLGTNEGTSADDAETTESTDSTDPSGTTESSQPSGTAAETDPVDGEVASEPATA